jgi:hypothetical protein
MWDMLRPGKYPCTCPPGSGDGHRVAHCHDRNSPYDDTGYIAVEMPPATAMEVDGIKRRPFDAAKRKLNVQTKRVAGNGQ